MKKIFRLEYHVPISNLLLTNGKDKKLKPVKKNEFNNKTLYISAKNGEEAQTKAIAHFKKIKHFNTLQEEIKRVIDQSKKVEMTDMRVWCENYI